MGPADQVDDRHRIQHAQPDGPVAVRSQPVGEAGQEAVEPAAALAQVVERAREDGALATNPRPVTADDLRNLLRDAW